MTNKILVTTDFSESSKAAMYFAIQLAAQNNSQLTFFHSYNLMRATMWSDAVFASYQTSEFTKVNEKLQQFVREAYASVGIVPDELTCVVKDGPVADQHIIDYAAQNNFDYICISRTGDGKNRNFVGSNTLTLVNKSNVPVIIVPNHYKAIEINDIFYASDLKDLNSELDRVLNFVKPLNASVELIHFKAPEEDILNPEETEKINSKLSEYQIRTNFKNIDYDKTLIENIESEIQRRKPEMLIMFTQQERTFFQKIFMSSMSADYAALSAIPILIFNKK
jgi:nucleotide-binding universal stress UspA family protein